ncbi:MAG: glycosyltransferase family 2 protein, partial [Ignavibacteria bacterium]|nr:glycosyltransferase family 2 protein [Ignavibacteria bacterium]
GGAVMAGYEAALKDSCDIVVKIDGDGQMDPKLISRFIAPILKGEADYTKGNRFYDIEMVKEMPTVRLFGNAILSFMTKFSSGYYNLFDPTNGYTAISATAAKLLPFSKINNRYFFESDILFRLNTIGAVVVDVPMAAVYGDEISNLHIQKILLPFLKGHASNFFKRIFYNYFLRGFSIASIELVLGFILLLTGVVFGIQSWIDASNSSTFASSGTVMLSAMPIIIGTQLLLSFLNYDIEMSPKKALTSLFQKDTNERL